MLLIICIIFMVIGLIFIWLKQITNYWTKRSVPCDRNLIYFRYKRHIAYEIQDLYKHWKDSGNAFIGSFILFQPVVLLLDLDLIKNVFISDFNTFPNRGFYHNLKDDPLSGNLFRLEGNEWKAVREKLTPTFSSGKMKYMFPTVVKVAHTFVEVLEKTIKYSSEVEMKDLCARFTTDVVGTVAFGLECNSLNDPQNEFRTVGDKAFTSLHPILETLFARYQSLARYFHLKVYSQMFNKFYTNIISQNIEYRTKNNIRRPDFLDILIELRNNKQNGKFGLSLEEIVGQSFVFFVGGFETSSSTMTYCLYELAKNPDIQNKARQVILKALKEHNNELSYECLQDMSYLNQIFMETLRKYPVAPTLRRIADVDYKVPHTSHILQKGTQVMIPVFGIHHDPEYYPDPTKFDPDRFLPSEIEKRPSITYLPFGAGPRNCIAERFGKMETLIGLVLLLLNFNFEVSSKTPDYLNFDPTNVRIFSVKDGLYLNVTRV